MAKFRITSPDGQSYEITAPDGATEAEVMAYAQSQFRAPTEAPTQPQASPQFRTGLEAEEGAYGVPTAVQGDIIGQAASGIGEGIRRAVAGGKQIVGGIQDTLGRFDKAGRSKKELYTEEENLRQKLDQIETQQAGKSVAGREVMAGIGEAVPLTLLPEAALPRAMTVAGGLVKNVSTGALGGLLQFDSEGKNVQNAGIGGAASGAVGILPSLPAAVKNTVARGLNKAFASGRTEALVASSKTALPNVQFSLAQATGVPELATLERAAYNTKAVNFYADQTDALIKDFVNVMQQPVKPGQTLAADFEKLRTDAGRTLKTMRRVASGNYEKGMSEAAIGATTGAVPVPQTQIDVANLKSQFQATAAQASDKLASGGQAILPRAFLRDLQAAMQKGSLTPHELARTLQGLTAIQKGENPVQRAMATRLRNALEADLDLVSQSGTLKADEATKKIIETRTEYKRAAQAADALSTSAAYKMLGVGDKQAPTSDVLLSKFKEYGTDKQNAVREYLEANSPDLLNSMRQSVVDEAVQASKTINPARDTQNSLDQLIDNLFAKDKGFAAKAEGLFSKTDIKKVDAIKDGLRVIANNRPTTSFAGTPIKPEDIVINVVSRSSEFAARQFARILMAGKGADLFTNEALYKAMAKFNGSTTGSAANLAARTEILTLLQTDFADTQEEQQ